MKNNTKSLTRIAIFTALICVGAFISIPMYPVPITLQNFFVFMAGLLLSPVEAFLSVLIYIILGLVGVPIFSGFTGGIQSVFKPTFGFLIAFAIGGYLISKLTKDTISRKKIFITLIIAEILFYLIGLPYLYLILKFYIGKAPESLMAVLSMGLIPFIPGDIIKMIVATAITPKIKKALQNENRN
ncbi:biotin transporter BioY [Peptoniphilus stercorisuis]|uniref:Biotin transporter n=1 Tax=Peptoniphilus stercorisuis TaxID=1436965 RepID=A0ABS4KG89_9FIRM|nr:biotin transporter BioY [Peptoniphilus stercorisuis]MBP2026161.1 biotin transport system substrate-specific component [Peptoniphilus stercorisuis]